MWRRTATRRTRKEHVSVKFRTYTLILRLSSSFFRTMLELPQPGEADAQRAVILPLDENATVIANALTMVSGKAFQSNMVCSSLLLFYISPPIF